MGYLLFGFGIGNVEEEENYIRYIIVSIIVSILYDIICFFV